MFPNTFPDKALVSELVAKMLLEIEAVHFRADQPFTFTSGLASPVYIDCRKLISYPRVRAAIMDFAASVIFRNVGFEQFDAVAGGETAELSPSDAPTPSPAQRGSRRQAALERRRQAAEQRAAMETFIMQQKSLMKQSFYIPNLNGQPKQF